MISSSVICTPSCTGLPRPLRLTTPDSISLQLSAVALAERQEHVNIKSKGEPLETCKYKGGGGDHDQSYAMRRIQI